ncbi:hypothetical protein G9272_25185 [Streptomyces asoensis]|uniref:Uncharacterized protein n=1 Tax=Streptomyces asoensis TaxID=249586 RepID=A0A6M4WSM0_9ACTN|nr:hypothetical protein [Streptomyces asoensis]QJT03169.1 hypothetical protein G9272_25185 [Streptomyces asoensis]
MTTSPARPALKSHPDTADQPDTADTTTPPAREGGRRKAARQGVLSALPTEQHPPGPTCSSAEDPTPDRPGIRIYAPPVYRHHYDGARWSKRYGDTPNAAYACTCGQTGTATGQHAVATLVAEYDAHKEACAGAPALHTERRNAA